MGLHCHLNYLVTIFVTHVVLHCFAVDLGRNNFRGLQHGQVIQDEDNNANEELDLYNKITSPKYSLLWKWKRSQTTLRNNKNGNKLFLQTTATPVLKGNYISLIPRSSSKSNTPSYIEFDYFNENQSQNHTSMKRLERFANYNEMMKVNHFKTSREMYLGPFIVSYHNFQDPHMRQELKTTQTAFLSKNRHKPLYPYFQPFNNTEIDKKGKSKNKLRLRDSISNIALLGQNEYKVKEYFKNTQVPTRTTLSDSTINLPVWGRKAGTVKAYLKFSRVPTRTSKSDLISNIPVLGLEAATVKAYFKSSRVPMKQTSETVSAIPNDRVKFFEMYDTNTRRPPRMIKLNESINFETQLNDIMSEKMEQNGHRNNNLGRPDNTNAATIEKKHNYKIRRSFKEETNSAISNQIQGKNDKNFFPMSIVNNTLLFPSASIFSKSEIMTKTAVVPWSSYPFASVYVYKPTQTHCDAAAISPHWLLAAGSCLSRHTLVHSVHARSAFVTYCGDHWRQPQRVAYVKRSVVHPDFNPRDQVRRLLYNIGLIQVSNSMDACPRWSPVSLMSHQFSTQPGGSVASAVGWGLDRYGTKYMTQKLPHWPLTVYDALVYHDTCPGSPAYGAAKRREGDGTSNVYCLLLPPYTKEESDPVHGGLLLVEGKLIALYLQENCRSIVGLSPISPSNLQLTVISEERRPRGLQSAQYTGVWRLLPWVMEVAREPDDAEEAFDV